MTRILIAHDHAIFREGLRSLLRMQSDMEVVGEAVDGRNAVRLAIELQPDIVILEVALPGLNGIEAARQITTEASNVRVLGLSLYSDSRVAMRMLQAGALAYLVRECSFEELLLAIRSALKNQVYLSPGAADGIVRGFVGQLSSTQSSDELRLSPREREVLQLLAEGKTTKEIASTLDISVKTVETHRKQIMDKLDLHSIAELTKYAIREGITYLTR